MPGTIIAKKEVAKKESGEKGVRSQETGVSMKTAASTSVWELF
jgi:hypothetical protein